MESFYEALLKAGQVKRGDILDVGSVLFSVMLRFREWHEKFDANWLLDALKEAVGSEGTVLIRTFNWDFCHGTPFPYSVDVSGDDSIFAFLEERNATLLRIGDVKVSCLTSMHRSEQRANIPQRFIKCFAGLYTGSDGICQEKTYSMFVRDLNYNIRVREDVMTENLQKKGVISQHLYEGIHIDKIDLKAAGDAVYQDILAGRWEDWVECGPESFP